MPPSGNRQSRLLSVFLSAEATRRVLEGKTNHFGCRRESRWAPAGQRLGAALERHTYRRLPLPSGQGKEVSEREEGRSKQQSPSAPREAKASGSAREAGARVTSARLPDLAPRPSSPHPRGLQQALPEGRQGHWLCLAKGFPNGSPPRGRRRRTLRKGTAKHAAHEAASLPRAQEARWQRQG